jgi:YD repeat-containing protein
VGNALTRTDPRKITSTYSYDGLNRVKQISYSDGVTPGAAFSYDAPGVANSPGYLTQAANGNSTTSYTNFDAMGNVLASTQATAGQSYGFSYSYNLAGALTSETYPSGRVVTTGYDGGTGRTR